jgi:pyrroline-5-carboxylate reductase
MTTTGPIAIIGAGHLGTAIARGLATSGKLSPGAITLTRRSESALEPLGREGFRTSTDNRAAVEAAETVFLCIQPQQLDGVLQELAPALASDDRLVISTVTGAPMEGIRSFLEGTVPLVRAMPNLGIEVGESMTCLATDGASPEHVARARDLFESVGSTMVIREDQMNAATALAGCGVAFFLRAIRAASQGGAEIGFHADEAIRMAAQTARAAATLLLTHGRHPEEEIDKVTTPKGCTIAGLNEMENRGFSSAMVRGIVLSSQKADHLYRGR